MSRLTPPDWKTLKKVFELEGFSESRTTADHIVMTKAGVARPVIIPKYAEIGLDIVKSNMRTAGMTRERYFELLTKAE